MIKTALKYAELAGAIVRNRCYIWLPGYLRNASLRRRMLDAADGTIDVMVAIVDHFEPSRREGGLGIQRVREWCDAYAKMTGPHRDSDGVAPQHTWFYRYDYPRYECLQILGEYVLDRYGEIEFHLHHGHDTSETFDQKIRDGVDWFNTAGAMWTAEERPRKSFAYIAGNWALDNGRRNDAMSGVNNELEILAGAGCYADFTFPAYAVNAQPRQINSIYYATDTPEPKSYDTGKPMTVGGQAEGHLTIFEGPTYIDWRAWHIEHASLETWAPYLPRRLNYWLNAGVHVEGRPEWLFVKLHTHGMQSREMFLGDQLDRMYSDLEAHCKNGRYRLHYVTAREAYNIAKAAEAGKSGDPNQYRDFLIPRPVNRVLYCDAPYRVDTVSSSRVRIEVVVPEGATTVRFRDRPVSSIVGNGIAKVELEHDGDVVRRLRVDGSGSCAVHVASGATSGIPSGKIPLPYIYPPN